jgi:CRP/FNR family transcriptional regulator
MANGNKLAVFPAYVMQDGWTIGGRGGASGWDSVLAASRQKAYAAKQVIYREGDSAETVFVVRRGLVKLIAHSPDGRMRIVRLHGKGALLGLGGLLDPSHEHTAVAVDEVELDCISLAAVIRLRKDNPELYCRLLESGYASLRSADLWITDFSTGPIRARVARLVNFLAALRHDAASGEVELLTCEEMAAILGVTVESVSRTLAEFKRGKLLRAVRRNPAKLYERDARALQLAAKD